MGLSKLDLRTLIDLEAAAEYCQISVETLRGWTVSGHAPHYFVDGKGPFYTKGEIRTWVVDNLVRHVGGMPIPRRLNVLCRPETRAALSPPPALAALESLCHLAIDGIISGIYFLCKDLEVVYVGQSNKVVARISTHITERFKDFDHERVFFLPCPKDQLTEVERRYIQLLRPRYNGNAQGNPHRGNWLAAERRASSVTD